MKPAWLHKLAQHLHLLRHEPDTFGFNLLQFSNPARLHDKLLDVLRAPALHVRLDPALRRAPALNVLQASLSPAVMTGGPNTAVNLALWIAHTGLPVRIVTTQPTMPAHRQWFMEHVATLTGQALAPDSLSVVCAGDPAEPLPLGAADMFLATHWTTAQQLRPLLPSMDIKRFFYLIQDFEPGFYAWSSNYALALETYSLDHIGVFNQSLLRDYVVAQSVGCYANADFAARSLVFEPAVDRAHFHPPSAPRPRGKRRLLFYARASNARNMLGLGLAALRAAVAHAVFLEQDWEFWAIGGNNSLPPMPLGSGRLLQPAPWLDYRAYAQLLRESDILLCPMLSPHTSYPVLEMAASGGLAVTNTFASKTAERLMDLSTNIVAAAPTEEALAHALVSAALRVRMGVGRESALRLPTDWRSALHATAQQVVWAFLHNAGGTCPTPAV